MFTSDTILHIPDSDFTSLDQVQSRPDWPKWQVALKAKYTSLRKHQVFGSFSTNLLKSPIGHKLILTARLMHGEMSIRYKVGLVAQGFSQNLGIDFDQIYSLVMDTTTSILARHNQNPTVRH